MQQDKHSGMFVGALLDGFSTAASMAWALTLQNPWIFGLVALALALKWLEARQRRRRPRR